ncbi:MAG TPA: M23 family metallopeptidase, partial [Longimicrobiales bacterium]
MVSPKLLKYVGAGAAACLGLAVILLLALGWNGTARIEAHQLRQENALLSGELDEFRTRVSSIRGAVDNLSRRDADMRLIAGLGSIDEDILQVGIGGPGLRTPESLPLWGVDSIHGSRAFTIAYDLDALERRALLLSESMSETTDSLQAHQDLLESTPSILPAPGLLSSRFTYSRQHPIHNTPLPHEGIDVSAPQGTPILAAANGRVVRAGWVPGYGQTVEIDHGYGYETLYGHASKILVRVGQTVSRGDVVAQVGRTGLAT